VSAKKAFSSFYYFANIPRFFPSPFLGATLLNNLDACTCFSFLSYLPGHPHLWTPCRFVLGFFCDGNHFPLGNSALLSPQLSAIP